MNRPKYSIVITTYNRNTELINCISSFKSLLNKEIIIIDDVSTKEIRHRNRNFINALDDKNIVYFESGEKLGLSKARQEGVKLSRGQWVFFIDDDDVATSQFIHWLNTTKLNNTISFYRFPYKMTNHKKIKKTWPAKRLYASQISTYLFNNDWFHTNEIHFEDIKLCEDDFLQVELYNKKNIKTEYMKIYSILYFVKKTHQSILNPINKKYMNLDDNIKLCVEKMIQLNVNDFKRNAIITILDGYKYYKKGFFQELGIKKELKLLYKKIKISSSDIFGLDPFNFFRFVNFWFKILFV